MTQWCAKLAMVFKVKSCLCARMQAVLTVSYGIHLSAATFLACKLTRGGRRRERMAIVIRAAASYYGHLLSASPRSRPQPHLEQVRDDGQAARRVRQRHVDALGQPPPHRVVQLLQRHA